MLFRWSLDTCAFVGAWRCFQHQRRRRGSAHAVKPRTELAPQVRSAGRTFGVETWVFLHTRAGVSCRAPPPLTPCTAQICPTESPPRAVGQLSTPSTRHHPRRGQDDRRREHGRPHRHELRLPGAEGDRRGGGSAIPYKRRLFGKIVAAAVRHRRKPTLPVTVKFRIGIDDAHHTHLMPADGSPNRKARRRWPSATPHRGPLFGFRRLEPDRQALKQHVN